MSSHEIKVFHFVLLMFYHGLKNGRPGTQASDIAQTNKSYSTFSGNQKMLR